MNTPNTHTQLPENLIVVDREWLDKQMKKLVDEHNSTDDEDDKSLCITKYTMLQHVKDYSYQLTPILDEYYDKVEEARLRGDMVGSKKQFKEFVLQQPITLKKK